MSARVKLPAGVLAAAFLAGCAVLGPPAGNFPRRGDARGTTVHGGKTWYVVPIAALAGVRKPHGLTYEGSTSGFHLIKEWLYVAARDEIVLFAVEKRECVVEEERRPEEEAKEERLRRRRNVFLGGNRCFVPSPYRRRPDLWARQGEVMVDDGINEEEAEIIAQCYFDRYGPGCGAAPPVTEEGDFWVSRTAVGVAGAPTREPIRVDKRSGRVTWSDGPTIDNLEEIW